MATFAEVIETLRDGKGYRFNTSGMSGYFYKAPFPEEDTHTKRDGALSAITYWENGRKATPTLMLYDFDDDAEWIVEQAEWPVGLD